MIARAVGGGLRVLERLGIVGYEKGAGIGSKDKEPTGLVREYRLLTPWGTLKFGMVRGAAVTGLLVSEFQELVQVDRGLKFCAEAARISARPRWFAVCKDCLLSLMAAAFGLSRGCGCICSSSNDSSDTEKSSLWLANESRIGEHAGDDPADVTTVRWPDDI